MKIRVTVEVDVLFEPVMIGDRYSDTPIDSDDVGQAVVVAMHDDIVNDSIQAAIKEKTNRRISYFILTTPEAECIDYLG